MKSCLLWLNVLADLFRFLVLSLRSESSLAAENLFLRKQLGFYQERKIKPLWSAKIIGRLENARHSRGFNEPNADKGNPENDECAADLVEDGARCHPVPGALLALANLARG